MFFLLVSLVSLVFSMPEMNVLIYGGGAVGLGLASCLLKAGVKVTILARAETAAALRAHGLIRTGIFGDVTAPAGTFGVSASLAELDAPQFDIVLVCTKSFDSETVAADLAAHQSVSKGDSRIVLCQNGWGNAEIFVKHLPKENIYNARVITGFIRPQPHVVKITVHAEAVHVGSLFGSRLEPVEPLCAAINAGDLPCEATSHIGKDLWAKMLYNCALNPLSAICRVPYGKLGEREETRQIMNQIIQEIFLVMRAAGYATHWDAPEGYLQVFYGKQVPLTALHESSTFQDLRAGKRTEIDAFNGAIVKLGQQAGLATPANLIVYNLIKFLEVQPKEDKSARHFDSAGH